MDASTLQKLLNSLRSSDAFSNISTTQSLGTLNSQELPGPTNLPEDTEHPLLPALMPSSESFAVSNQITALLSQLGPRRPLPETPQEQPTLKPLVEEVTEPPFSEPPVPFQEQPPPDLKSMGYAESLSRIEPLLRNSVASSILRKLQDDQKDVETKLWGRRQAVMTEHEKRVQAARQQARIVTGVDSLEPRETQRLNQQLKKALDGFDREVALPAWDALLKRQQEALENLGVPSMFVTSDVTERSRQQRLIRTEVHNTIIANQLFKPGDRVAIGASGGKDSTVLAHVMKTLNDRYDYGLELFLLSIDEGITGYRDDSLETVKRNQQQYNLPLKILSYDELYGWTMDAIVAKIGKKNNCTFCGVFRRQALDRGAASLNVDHIVTGHNADDIAETVLMNREDTIRRSKPFKYAYEKEIVMYVSIGLGLGYAYFKKLDYFSTECIYSPDAYRGHARVFLKDLEAARPSAIIDIIHSGEAFKVTEEVKKASKAQQRCLRCGYISSNDLCKACVLLEGLEKGTPSAVNEKRHDRLDITNTEPEMRTLPMFQLPPIMTPAATPSTYAVL
ncbi:nucleotidyltransferase [Tulasnella sp. 330]|nr:nucleotidyltransferase [Tulasnella sp. 330]